ncbi:MAG: hypothetical protein HY204_10100 [Nitrospirae bacterium]|nr:hypothetical protein [Nitrospirota bacterium]
MMLLSEFKNLLVSMPIPYQAFSSKKSTWDRHINREDKAGYALGSIFGNSDEISLSRNDLRNLAKDPDLAKFVMATIIWGYPRGMRGNNVDYLIGNLDPLTQLLSAARAQPVADWNKHYAQVEPIKGIGLSTYTKFLSFLSVYVQDHTALILDYRIIQVANQGVFEELAPLRKLSNYNAARSYPLYLECMHKQANSLSVSAEGIEFFLFEFGLNLKPVLPQHIVPVNCSQTGIR